MHKSQSKSPSNRNWHSHSAFQNQQQQLAWSGHVKRIKQGETGWGRKKKKKTELYISESFVKESRNSSLRYAWGSQGTGKPQCHILQQSWPRRQTWTSWPAAQQHGRVQAHHPLRRKWNIHLSQKHVFRTGKHKSCFLTRIGIMSIWESEMQSIMLFDYWCFSHTTSFLRATVKKQNCVTWTSVSGETLPSKQAIV